MTITMLLPIVIFLWLVGWSLFWAGSKNKSQKIQTDFDKDLSTVTSVMLEEPLHC
jgi:nitrogen fixation-related uncharacterized protein